MCTRNGRYLWRTQKAARCRLSEPTPGSHALTDQSAMAQMAYAVTDVEPLPEALVTVHDLAVDG